MASEADKKAEEDKKADEIKKKSDKQKEELDTLNSKVVEKDNKIKALQAEVEKLGMPDSKTISLSASGTKQISGDAYENMAKFLVDNSGMGGDRRIF
jgi:predicted  nucleic acid-binding Zn-ribbon protein